MSDSHRKRILPLILFLLSLVLMAGCDTPALLGRAETPVPSPVGTQVAPESNIAPSYETIRKHTDSITYTPQHPKGPEVGPDGVVDPGVMLELNACQATLVGKQAVNWHGWVSRGSLTEARYTGQDGLWTVSVYMDEADIKNETLPEIGLSRVTQEQVQALPAYTPSPSARCAPSMDLWGVVFSGKIEGITLWGGVYITDVTIKPSE